MAGRLDGKTAVITAAARGIGRASALAFADEGAQVIATDLDADALRVLRAERPDIDIEVLDVTDADAVYRCAAERPADILLNCAGVVPDGTLLDTDPDAWRASFELNVHSMYHSIGAWLPAMLERGGGSIVNIASVASSIRGVPRRCAYGATKGAVIGLTKAVAADFVGQGIRVNVICPGTIDTPSLEGRMAATGNVEVARRAFVARQPMGRLGQAAEVAALALYLASDEAAFTTGAIHVIDGGWTM